MPRPAKPMHAQSELPRRKQLRLGGYDYSFPGAYFVTICSAGKQFLFGSIIGKQVVLSPAGEVIRSEWTALPERFPRLILDEFVIMPNHLHGILAFVGEGLAPPASASLADVIRVFKSISTININRLLRRSGAPVWQRSYYEHIIRKGEDLRKIQRYILENPLVWSLDPENPYRKPG